jgi:TatD DNase family protein
MGSMIDTHAHLCDPSFDSDLPQVLERSKTVGVTCIIAVGENMKDAEKNLQLSSQYPMIRPAAGLYPTVLSRELASAMCEFIRAHRERLAGIGEVGLDHWVVKSEEEWEVQLEIFRGFIALSKELDLPLNVHSRSAGRHAVAALLEAGASKVQMHAFDGKYGTALPAVEAGYFFSVPPSIVRSEQKRKLVKLLPLSSLLIETDSPVLGPAPQERNEPSNAVIALKAIAEVKGMSEEVVKEAVAENTHRLYGKP